jgi:hypothetical protein
MEELKSLLPILKVFSESGLALAIFIIWYFTFTKSDRTTKAAFEKHATLSGDLIQLLKDDQEYKIMLAGILERLEYRLSIPTQCPLAIAGAEKLKELLGGGK